MTIRTVDLLTRRPCHPIHQIGVSQAP
jgi:hypothetical protein